MIIGVVCVASLVFPNLASENEEEKEKRVRNRLNAKIFDFNFLSY